MRNFGEIWGQPPNSELRIRRLSPDLPVRKNVRQARFQVMMPATSAKQTPKEPSMKKLRAMTTVAILLAAVVLALAQAQRGGGGGGGPQAGAPGGAARGAAAGPAMTLTTTGWQDGAVIPNKYTQAVPMPVSPALTWANAPAGTQSFVLHFHDPDVALNGSTNDQVHWLVWNIPGTATSFAEGMPSGATLPDGSRQISASGQVYR